MFLAQIYCAEPIALILKLKGIVKVRSENSNKFKPLKTEMTILNSDEIKLKRNSFIKVVFLDDGNKLICYQESDFKIESKLIKRDLKKKIIMEHGLIKIDNRNEINVELEFETHYSKINLSKGSFWIESVLDEGDFIYNLNGEVEIYNKKNKESKELISGELCNSLKDGQITTERFHKIDLLKFDQLEINMGEKNVEEDEQQSKMNLDSILTNINEEIILFQLENDKGQRKEIKIKYKNLKLND